MRRKSKKALLLGVLSGFILTISHAQALESQITHKQSSAVRDQTVRAIQTAERGNWPQAEKMIVSLNDPMASKLFYWLVFTQGPEQNWSENQFVRLSQFIRQNPAWPAMKTLVGLAEKAMPYGMPAPDVIAWYDDYAPQTAKGMDQYMQALLETAQTEKGKKLLSEWWANKPLGQKEQQDMFRKYFSYLDRGAHQKRIDALLLAGQYTNARAIADILQSGYPELVEARIALAEEKPDVAQKIASVPSQLREDPGFLYERLRWRRRNDMDEDAIAVLRHQPPSDQLRNPESWWKERHIIIRRLLERHQYREAYQLARDHEQTDGLPYAEAEWLKGWLALRFLHQPVEGLQSFTTLYDKVKTSVSKTRAAYWAGRAAQESGQTQLATEWFNKAAKNQTVYYGQLAASELSMGASLPANPPPVITDEDKGNFEANELVQAARILNAAGLRDETSQFIQAFVQSDKTPKVYMYGAVIAADMKHYHDAVRIAKDATNEGLFLTAQSYPLMLSSMRGVQTEWALVHAIIRQESMFDEDAQSPAGALGLMQVMPATGSEVARKLGISHTTAMLIDNPAHNIQIGSAYLDRLLNRYDGSYVMTIASYNAGPGNVDKWIDTFGDPRAGQMDLIDWIEMIPISETRNYVQRVLENVYIYRLRLEGKQAAPVHNIHIAMP